MNRLISSFFGVVFLCSSTVMAQGSLHPDIFVVESVSFSPGIVKAGQEVTATAIVSLLEPRPENCKFVKCWAQMTWPTGGSVYLGDMSCEMQSLDPMNIKVTLKSQTSVENPRGFYKFQGLSLQASCHNYAFYYDGPSSRFRVVD
jgi:hypothetical protein